MPLKNAAAKRAYNAAYFARKYAENPEPHKTRARENHRKKVRALASRPAPERCESCGGRSEQTLHLDHCHSTGDFRGWLCRGCNLAAGHLGDSPYAADNLAAYLRRHQLA